MTEHKAVATDADVALISEFLDQLWLDKGVSSHTLSAYGTDLKMFAAFLQQHGSALLKVDSYQVNAYLALRYDKQYSPRSTSRALSSLRRFYGQLHQQGKIADNPLSQLANPKLGRNLPKTLSEQDVDALLAAPDLQDLSAGKPPVRSHAAGAQALPARSVDVRPAGAGARGGACPCRCAGDHRRAPPGDGR